MAELTCINDRYQILNEIGHGGYSKIFLAFDPITNKEVAIKVLKKEVSSDSADYLMIRQEAMTMAALNSPHIAKIYECGIYNNNPYIVMDYIKGKILRDLLKARSYLLVEEVYDIAMQAVDGLEKIHMANMFHRDIKPANMILKADGTLVLVDFGTTTVSDESLNVYHDKAGALICTVQYMAPELTNNTKGSVQSDIYALGITLFELLTGKLPYNSKDKMEIVRMHIKVEFPKISSYRNNVPKSLEKIIYKCVSKSTETRYKNVNELKVDLLKSFNEYKNPKKKNIFERLFKK